MTSRFQVAAIAKAHSPRNIALPSYRFSGCIPCSGTPLLPRSVFSGASHLLGRNRLFTNPVPTGSRGPPGVDDGPPETSRATQLMISARRKFGRLLDLPIGAFNSLVLHLHASAGFCSLRTDRRHLKFDFDGAGLLKL